MNSASSSQLLAAFTLAATASGAAGCSDKAAAMVATAPAKAEARPAPVVVNVSPAVPAASAPSPPAAADARPGGSGAPVPPGAPGGARIYSKARFAWINPGSHPSRGWAGYLGLGGSVALRGGSPEAARTPGKGCDAWYAVEPRGYVCAGASATIDPEDPVVVALRPHAPRVDSPWPYEYAESTDSPRYRWLPTRKEQRAKEGTLDEHLAKVARAREVAGAGEEAIRAIDERLVGVDVRPAGVGVPELFAFGDLVREDRKRIIKGSTVAFTKQFDDPDGRTWVVTSDQMYMPKDRLKLYPRSEFQGVWLKEGRSLPLAFFRKTARPRYTKRPDGGFEATGASFARLARVGLTGRSEGEGEDRFVETQEPGVWVRANEAVVIEAAKRSPLEGENPEGAPPRKWIEVSVLGGWLVAYEELTPVFATLISPGRGGVPRKGIPPIETASTPTGRFRVDGKFVTATMVSSTNEKIVHSDVQFVQNFHGAHSLHAAYWHDDWGEPKSGGCVNLSPLDAKEMYAWTDPPVPAGWHGLRATPDAGRSTVVIVHR
jgi:L,D-transpeptidase catalytic domain